ncbi:hypothetical protein [Shewanella sp. Arc9-LZ]|uniref:hypothetical protein n=1 Tax=Shewanella sp. Arc9-LZ TaxID=2698686 RepID=UPI00137C19FA|nr:hypothetical protein [Shewanella sp. Arc9-LZ]QHS13469.1 hypothetical protein GUY17_10245 [Shewanella sp. Arc9-LZ]
MNIKKWMWKIATILVMGVLILNPEFVALALFVDAVGLDLFLLLFEVQIVAVIGYYFHAWFKPVLRSFYKCLLKFDPYFFIPTKDSVGKSPIILCHAVPFMMLLIIGVAVA